MKFFKRLSAVALVIALFVTIFNIASAATYSAIELDVPYYRQRASGMCSFSAFSMAEAYATGYGANADVVYQAIRTAHAPASDGGYISDPYRSPALIDGKRYKSISTDYATIYSYLKKGQPVVIYRNGSTMHWSVIYGYTGNTAKLETGGFQVINGVMTNNNNYEKKESLTSFLSASDAKLTYAVVRVNGVLAHKNNTSYSQNMNSYFANCSVSGITETNATIKGIFTNNTSISSAGFYIGTDSTNLKKVSKNLSGGTDGAGTYRSIYYSMNKWFGTLKPGTKYYYKLYYIKSGKEYTSPVNWFVTKGQAVTLSSIAVSSVPEGLTFYVGDALSTSGVTLLAKYSDNSTKTITSGFSVSPTILTKAGTQKITLTYEGKSVSYNINVKKKMTVETSLKGATVKSGAEFSLPLTISESNDVVFMEYNLTYDESLLTLKDSDWLISGTASAGNVWISPFGANLNGKLLDFTFSAAESDERIQTEVICEMTIKFSGEENEYKVKCSNVVTIKPTEQETTTVLPETTTQKPADTTTAEPETTTLKPSETTTFKPTETTDNTSVTVLKGDMNLDGRITAADARIALRIASRIETAAEMLISIGDMNDDGKLNAADARNILRKAAGLE